MDSNLRNKTYADHKSTVLGISGKKQSPEMSWQLQNQFIEFTPEARKCNFCVKTTRSFRQKRKHLIKDMIKDISNCHHHNKYMLLTEASKYCHLKSPDNMDTFKLYYTYILYMSILYIFIYTQTYTHLWICIL